MKTFYDLIRAHNPDTSKSDWWESFVTFAANSVGLEAKPPSGFHAIPLVRTSGVAGVMYVGGYADVAETSLFLCSSCGFFWATGNEARAVCSAGKRLCKTCDGSSDARTEWTKDGCVLHFRGDNGEPRQHVLPLKKKELTPFKKIPSEPGVYFAKAGAHVKIGVAKNIKGRLHQVQTGNPQRVELIGWIPKADVHVENKLHDRFAKFTSARKQWWQHEQAKGYKVTFSSFDKDEVVAQLDMTMGRPPFSGIYFARVGECVKIGISDAIGKRLTTLQTASPYPIELIGWIPNGTKELERKIHQRFRKLNMRGEWFKLDKRLMKFIQSEEVAK